jgi:seryl-tRNA synthetase
MLDINFIEDNLQEVITNLKKRNQDYTQELNFVVEKNKLRKEILMSVEKLKAEKNQISKAIGQLIAKKEFDQVEVSKTKVSTLNTQINQFDEQLKIVVNELNNALAYLPNMPQADVVVGTDEKDNLEIRR